jgi:hypothetical protein
LADQLDPAMAVAVRFHGGIPAALLLIQPAHDQIDLVVDLLDLSVTTGLTLLALTGMERSGCYRFSPSSSHNPMTNELTYTQLCLKTRSCFVVFAHRNARFQSNRSFVYPDSAIPCLQKILRPYCGD